MVVQKIVFERARTTTTTTTTARPTRRPRRRIRRFFDVEKLASFSINKNNKTRAYARRRRFTKSGSRTHPPHPIGEPRDVCIYTFESCARSIYKVGKNTFRTLSLSTGAFFFFLFPGLAVLSPLARRDSIYF